MNVMVCPKCQTPMREREKEDVIMDVCPNCRGVWLDAGELEKLTAREERYYQNARWDDDDDDDDDQRRRGSSTDPQGRTQRYEQPRRGFLGGLFDGFGD